MPTDAITVGEFIESLDGALELEAVTGDPGANREMVGAGVSRPGLLLAGFESGFRADCLQLLGGAEMAYLESLSGGDLGAALDRLCAPTVPFIVLADGRKPPGPLLEAAGARGIPVYVTSAGSDRFARDAGALLDVLFAPSTTVHATLVDVYGVGLLFTGKSGIGKSECGLDLVENGHRLVADDIVYVTRTPQDNLIGTGSDVLRHCMEIRGVGIIDIQSMFGIRAIRQRKRVEVEVKLVSWSDLEDYERLGLEEETSEILGVQIPAVTLPLVIGKNISVISEVIALNHLLKIRGIHPAREFDRRQREQMKNKVRRLRLLRGDNE